MEPAIISVLCLIIGFLVCHFVPQTHVVLRYFRNKAGEYSDNVRSVLFQRLLGVVFFGFIPMMIILLGKVPSSLTGLNFSFSLFPMLAGCIVGMLLIFINFLNRKNPENLAMYPQIRKPEWNVTLLLVSALSWLIYIYCYEFIFRGFLLFSTSESFGIWNAVTLNIAFYSLVHVPKGWKEAIGSLPLGLIFCIMCLKAGNFLPSFVAHSCLALSTEWFALSNHPSISVIHYGRK